MANKEGDHDVRRRYPQKSKLLHLNHLQRQRFFLIVIATTCIYCLIEKWVYVHQAHISDLRQYKLPGIELADGGTHKIEALKLAQDTAQNSATGKLFHGKQFRRFEGARNSQIDHQSQKQPLLKPDADADAPRKWSVVTTIFDPSRGIINAAALKDWCLVIVADTKTPVDYVERAGFSRGSCVHFLSVEDQRMWADENGAVGEFIQVIPFQHFSRKNLGYLYAIQHGAQYIFDFDDDNVLVLDEKSGTVTDPVPDDRKILQKVRIPILGKKVLNHHPLMGVSMSESWARGFPLELIQDTNTHGSPVAFSKDIAMSKIGVMQYCANSNPDIDAIHRLSKPLPMSFDSTKSALLVPAHAFAPYNAQATIHTRSAMFALLLPSTVPGRVSDIWRGYFAQCLFRDLDLALVFLPPQIDQIRNEHNYLADMNAELDLYFKSGKLIEFLSSWDSPAENLDERMEQLWIELYERGYIEIDDVYLLQRWLRALVSVGYEFPRVIRKRENNIILMGQFNYGDIPTDSVVFWAQRWRSIVPNVVVRGPFDSSKVLELRQRGVEAKTSVADKGFVSPIRNLLETMEDFSRKYRGVMYIHDDAILNTTHVFESFPYDSIVGTKWGGHPLSYQDVRYINDNEELAKKVYRLLPGAKRASAVDGLPLKQQWSYMAQCIRAMKATFSDSEFDRYKDTNGAFLVPSVTQADFLYVPSAYVDEYMHAAQTILRHNMFLECGFPTIVQMMRQVSNVSVATFPVCTNWSKGRGTEAMLAPCLVQNKTFGMFHPLKMSIGLSKWDEHFDRLTS